MASGQADELLISNLPLPPYSQSHLKAPGCVWCRQGTIPGRLQILKMSKCHLPHRHEICHLSHRRETCHLITQAWNTSLTTHPEEIGVASNLFLLSILSPAFSLFFKAVVSVVIMVWISNLCVWGVALRDVWVWHCKQTLALWLGGCHWNIALNK